MSEEDIIEFLTFKEKINDDVNETSNNVFQWESRFDVNIIHRLIILNIMNKIIIISFAQIDIKEKIEKIDFQFKMWRHIENVDMNVFEMNNEIEWIFALTEIQLKQLTI